MNTKLKVILTAISIATLASPVMAKSDSHAAAPAASISRTAPAVEGNPYHIDDAVHVAFPQQDAGN
jgi:hypothetical protein